MPPLLTYSCNGRQAVWIVLQPRLLVAVLYNGTVMTFIK